MGVVQAERHLAREGDGRAGELGRGVLEQCEPVAQGPREAFLLADEDTLDQVPVSPQDRICISHRGDRGLDQRWCHKVGRPGASSGEDRTSNDPAQDIASALVRGQDAVRDQHRHRAAVISQDAQGDVRGLICAIATSGQRLCGLEQACVGPGGEDRIGPLEHREDALEARTGVDRLLRQIAQLACGIAVVLHEDEVPDLDEPLLAAVGRPTVGAVGRALVVVDLRARSTGSGLPHPPEVVLTEALDPFGRHTDEVTPDGCRLIIAVVDGDPEPVSLEPERLRQQGPCHLDGTFLEVVPEAEVPEHLEERAVSCGGADDVDIHRPEALLHRCRTRERRLLLAHEVRLERHHASDREQDARIVRDQACRRDDRVVALSEEVQKRPPEGGGIHPEDPTGVLVAPRRRLSLPSAT